MPANGFTGRGCHFIVVICFGLWLQSAGADTVWMQNGDKLSGQIQGLNADKLYLLTDYGGRLELDWHRVKEIKALKQPEITDTKLKEQYLSRLTVPITTDVAITATEADAKDGEVDKRTFWGTSDWKGNLDLSLNHKSASSSTTDYAAKLKTRWRSGQWRNRLDADYARKTTNTITTSNNYGGRFASNRFIGKQWFWQGRALYKWDQIEDVKRQAAIGTGPGYQFWEDETGAFSVAGILSRVRYDYRDGFQENFYAASLNWDYSRYISGDRLELYTTGELMRPLSNAAEVSIDAVVGLRYRMTDWMSWFLSYSRNQISGGRENLDEKRISTGLGLSW